MHAPFIMWITQFHFCKVKTNVGLKWSDVVKLVQGQLTKEGRNWNILCELCICFTFLFSEMENKCSVYKTVWQIYSAETDTILWVYTNLLFWGHKKKLSVSRLRPTQFFFQWCKFSRRHCHQHLETLQHLSGSGDESSRSCPVIGLCFVTRLFLSIKIHV